MHIFILRESICPGPMKLGRQLVIGIVITFSKSSLSLGIKRETTVTNICLKCITFINLTFRMLQHTSSEVIIIQLQINLNSKIQLYGLGTNEID